VEQIFLLEKRKYSDATTPFNINSLRIIVKEIYLHEKSYQSDEGEGVLLAIMKPNKRQANISKHRLR